jgi:hypothetical protein
VVRSSAASDVYKRQALTLYTTPVIYLWFDALGRRKGKPEVS